MSTINVETVEEHEDGSATMSFEFDDETTRLILKQGFKAIMEEEGIKDIVICDPIEPLSKDARTYELSDDEYQLLIHMGVMSALKLGMEYAEESARC